MSQGSALGEPQASVACEAQGARRRGAHARRAQETIWKVVDRGAASVGVAISR